MDVELSPKSKQKANENPLPTKPLFTPVERSFLKELWKINLLDPIPKDPEGGKKEYRKPVLQYKHAAIFLAKQPPEEKENAEELALKFSEYRRVLLDKEEKYLNNDLRKRKITKLKSEELTHEQEEETITFLEEHTIYDAESHTTRLVETVLDYGTRELIKEIKDPTNNEDRSRLINNNKLRDTISRLEELRKNESSNKEEIGMQERKVAYIIQKLVSKFKPTAYTSKPSEILKTNEVNCVGASLIGGALMKIAGLNYLVGNIPEHSIIVLITSNGEVEWLDMMYKQYNLSLNDKNIKKTSIANIIEFSNNKPTKEGLAFYVNNDKYKENSDTHLTVHKPKNGHNIQALDNLGVTLAKQGQFAEATKAYRIAIKIYPNTVNVHYNLGIALTEQGKLDEATKAYRRVIELDPFEPKYVRAYSMLGIALARQGKLDEATKAYESAIKLDSSYFRAHYNLGNVLTKQRQFAEATDAYRSAIKLDSNDVDAHYNLGNALTMQGKLDEATNTYRRVIELKSNHVRAHYKLGIALAEQGKLDEAIVALKEASKLDPENEKYRSLTDSIKNQQSLVNLS